MRYKVKLRLIGPDGRVEKVSCSLKEGERLSLGRSTPRIDLNHPSVADEHCSLFLKDGAIFIRPDGTAEITKGGERLGVYRLRLQDKIDMGAFQIEILEIPRNSESEDDPSQDEPPQRTRKLPGATDVPLFDLDASDEWPRPTSAQDRSSISIEMHDRPSELPPLPDPTPEASPPVFEPEPLGLSEDSTITASIRIKMPRADSDEKPHRSPVLADLPDDLLLQDFPKGPEPSRGSWLGRVFAASLLIGGLGVGYHYLIGEWNTAGARKLVQQAGQWLSQAASGSKQDAFARAEFFEAARKGKVSVLNSLLSSKRVTPDLVDERGVTALMVAASEGQVGAVKFLLSRGAQINSVDNQGTTALIWAAFKGNEAVVRELVNRGANIHIARKDGDTAYKVASRWGHRSLSSYLSSLSAGSVVPKRIPARMIRKKPEMRKRDSKTRSTKNSKGASSQVVKPKPRPASRSSAHPPTRHQEPSQHQRHQAASLPQRLSQPEAPPQHPEGTFGRKSHPAPPAPPDLMPQSILVPPANAAKKSGAKTFIDATQ